MVNAGAIATASLIEPLGFEKPIDRILHEYSQFAGRHLKVDEQVFTSENETGNRNRAIAYLLKNAGVIDRDVEGWSKPISANAPPRSPAGTWRPWQPHSLRPGSTR